MPAFSSPMSLVRQSRIAPGRLEGFHYRAADKAIDLEPPRRRRRLDRGNVDGRKRSWKSTRTPSALSAKPGTSPPSCRKNAVTSRRSTEQPNDLIDHVAGKIIENSALTPRDHLPSRNSSDVDICARMEKILAENAGPRQPA